MKKLVYTIALFGLVVMAGCSGDSPSPSTPGPLPTVIPAEWTILSLTVSDPNPDIGATVLIEAVVQQNGLAAPDGTAVEFLASGGQFLANGGTQASVNTVNGRASIQFTAATSGNYTIQARVRNVTRQVTISFRDPDTDEELVIHLPLIPNVGSFDGGEMVYLRGTGIRSPVEVTFDVQGVLFQAAIVEVLESDPLSAPGQIKITTPLITGIDRTVDQVADVIVKRGVGTASEQMVTLDSAFTFLAGLEPPTAPVIYGLDPAWGQRLGGDQVTVFGRNLDIATRAVFTFRGSPLEAQILSASPDGLQMLISTPRFSATAMEQSEFADFSLESPAGPSNVLTQAFLVIADDPTPEIASISPIAGPLGGGTLVSIFGSGFHVPVQVKFGNLTATDVNVIDDQSPADQDVITCLSPDYSQQGQVPPVTVDVTVTNMTSGRISNARQFIYGDILFISGNSPTEGRPGDQVVIYGAGFEDPLQVFFGSIELEVQSVSGTEILVRFPDDLPVECSDTTGQFRVRLIESNQEATGGTFTLRGNQPTVTSVEDADDGDVFVGEGSDIIIHGADFLPPNVLVEINNSQINPNQVNPVDDTLIEVDNLPSAIQLGVNFDTATCTAPGDVPGERLVATPVDVSVTNLPGSCEDILTGGVVYEPTDTACNPTPIEIVTSPIPIDGTWEFDATSPGGCSAWEELTVVNNGGVSAENLQILVSDLLRFPTIENCPSTLIYNEPCTVITQFCPQVGDPGDVAGTLGILHDGIGTPLTVFLLGPITP
jgi:hypothetical protein